MNIFLWILQALLCLFLVAGGYYKFTQFDELAKQVTAIPPGVWRVLGIVEMVGGVLLIVPAATKWLPMITPVAALVLTLETAILVAIYAQQSLKLTAQNPLVWAAAMALLLGFVAYGRYSLQPIA